VLALGGLEFESSFEEETPSEEIVDNQYNSHERHYFLPQNLGTWIK
jgi:hypothetical protein